VISRLQNLLFQIHNLYRYIAVGFVGAMDAALGGGGWEAAPVAMMTCEAAPGVGLVTLFTPLLLCVKTHSVDDSWYSPRNQSDSRYTPCNQSGTRE
jgi:hypothetical protein